MNEPTATELLKLWRERDARYRVRKIGMIRAPLTENEIASIRAWRKREVEALPAVVRSEAWRELMAWIPPEVRTAR